MSKTAFIQVTENRSTNPTDLNLVRVFVNKDWDYGFWVSEDLVFSKLDDAQKESYLKCESEQEQFEIPIDDAQHLIDEGASLYPYYKKNLIKEKS